MLRDTWRVSCGDYKEEEGASSNSPKQIMHSPKHLEQALIFSKHMINEHVNIIS